ncbi:PREDICTED: uncharacterized protein LOC104589448 isoform X2 [Nelumbo nucifera]|nr:PREDICTED: uncharacterized protein LOC104589448 isoform X2 [Nelumbo nucifera]XP_010246094.1 PREDICTED: uncharacterized protein LOC104589448 isoform X2 [Nelumbo nucifera]
MGILINGGANAEMLLKRPLENGFAVPNDFLAKYKRRKMSANRDFPKGCGRFASISNRISREGDAVAVIAVDDSNVRVECVAAILEPGPVNRDSPEGCGGSAQRICSPREVDAIATIAVEDSKVGVEGAAVLEPNPANLDFSNGSERVAPITNGSSREGDAAAVIAIKDLKVGAGNASVLESIPALQVGTCVNFEAPALLEGSVRAKPLDSSENLKTKSPKLLESPVESEAGEPAELLDSSKNLDMQATSILELQSAKNSVLAVTLELSKISDQPQPSSLVVDNTNARLSKKYPSRSKISANRDFPQGCGRNAPSASKEEQLRAISSSGGKYLADAMPSGKQIGQEVQGRDVFNDKSKGGVTNEIEKKAKSKGDVTKEMAEHFQVKITCEVKDDAEQNTDRIHDGDAQNKKPKGNVHKELKEQVQIRADSESNSKWEDTEETNMKSPREITTEDSPGFGHHDNRVIVQALMAAPNCPWRQGRRAFKSTPTSYTKNKAKKSENGVREKSASVSRKKNNESGNLVGKTTKKLSLIGKIAYEEIGQLVVREEEDFLEHEQEAENIPVGKKSHDLELSLIPFGVNSSSDKGARNKVRETLRLFQVICRKLLQEEEAKSRDQGNPSKRIDLIASAILKDKNKWVNTEKILGPVPGVEVGDEFHFRVELAIIGLHRPFQGGIDYMKQGKKIIATSIVALASGDYADDMDSSDVLVYTGSGGKPASADKKAEDQKLERGNLSLKNSMDAGTFVRVIRGYKEMKASDTKGKLVSTYIYDGLYKVEKFWQERGRYGSSVFKYQLRRNPGQPELALKEVKKSKKLKVREGLCVDDISGGKEKMRICAVNTIDDEKPPQFTYTTNIIYAEWYNQLPPRGCDCTDGCSDSEKCFCAVKNGGEIPFNYNGAIVEAKPLVYECGPSCKCPPSCHNRVSQHGIKFQLEIFKTKTKGWGVRSLTSIPSGSFICEYTGELLEDKEAEQRTNNDEYLFDIGHNYNDHTLWDGLSTLVPDLQTSSSEVVEDVGFTIDAALYGNIGRFVNHSCSPNCYAQNVLYDHDDKRMPHIMLFAAENIPPLQELTYHYNYMIDQVHDSDGNIKKKNCYCGSHECTGRLY